MEILENSIIQLIVRQGSDTDRNNIVLESGELGYTTDTERLFIGNGVQTGGNLVGNLFKGSAPTITDASLRPAMIGDFAFETDTQKLYRLKSSTGANTSDWELIGSTYSASTGIGISNDNEISVLPISSGQISTNAVESPIKISSGKISLSPLSANHISTNAVLSPITITGGKIGLSPLSANHISENAIVWPLTIDDDGKLVNYSTRILLRYYALSGSKPGIRKNAKINVSTYSKLSTGHYSVIFDTESISVAPSWPNYNYYPIVQILGEDALDCQARVVNMTLSSCEIKVINPSGVTKDANIVLNITY